MKFTYFTLNFKLLVFAVLCSVASHSQVLKTGASSADFELFKSSEMVVVQGFQNAEFDSLLEVALADYWTLSEYTFIDSIEYESMKDSPSKFFMVPEVHPYDRYRSSESGRVLVESHIYWNLQIIRGNGGALGPELTLQNPVPVSIASTFGSLWSKLKPIDILPVIVKNLQLQCNEIELDKFIAGRARVANMNKNTSLIQDKPLYICKKDLNDKITSVEDVKQYYDGDVYVVEKDEYAKLIKENTDVNIVFCINDFTQNYVRIFEVTTGRALYYKRSVVHEKYPSGIIKYHIKKW